jgi:hypothetical protein
VDEQVVLASGAGPSNSTGDGLEEGVRVWQDSDEWSVRHHLKGISETDKLGLDKVGRSNTSYRGP